MLTFFRNLSPNQATGVLIALFAALRLWTAGAVGLSVDEAHYALYGFYLDWSYFDHPPLIGWLQALILTFGSSDTALRLMPIGLFALASVTLHRLCSIFFPNESPWIGTLSVALLHSAAILQLVGFAMLPDTPLLLIGLLAMLALHGVIVRQRTRDWLWLGVCLGLAALAKYTAVTLVFSVVLALTFSRQWGQLRRAGPWLAIVLGLVLISPVLLWNARHDWMSFAYQLHHGTGNLHWQLKHFGLTQAAQFLVYGPVLFVFGLIAMVAAWRERRKLGVLLCLALALPVLLMFGWNSGYVMSLPHWTSLGWAGLAPLAARWILRVWPKRIGKISVLSASVLSLSVLVLMFSQLLHPWLPFKDNENVLRDLYGWQSASQRAETLRLEMAKQGVTAPVLFTSNWTYSSRLAWYARPSPVVVLDDRNDQFDLWFGSPQAGASGILLWWPDQSPAELAATQARFASCTLKDQLPVVSNNHLVSTFTYYACLGFKH